MSFYSLYTSTYIRCVLLLATCIQFEAGVKRRKVIRYSYLILKKSNKQITDS